MSTTRHQATTPTAPYTRPSDCDLCVITETTTNQTANTWATELAHQETCPNSPRKDTNIHGK